MRLGKTRMNLQGWRKGLFLGEMITQQGARQDGQGIVLAIRNRPWYLVWNRVKLSVHRRLREAPR